MRLYDTSVQKGIFSLSVRTEAVGNECAISDVVRVCLCVNLLHVEYQITHFNGKVRTFLGSGDILTGPHNFKGVYPL